MTLRTAVSVGTFVLGCFILLGGMVHHYVNQHFIEMDANRLQTVLTHIEEEWSGLSTDQGKFISSLQNHAKSHHGIFIGFYDAKQAELYSNHSSLTSTLLKHLSVTETFSYPALEELKADAQKFRAIRLQRSLGIHSYDVVMAISIDFHQEFLQHFTRFLWGGIFIFCLFSIVVVYVMVRVSLSPVRAISRRVSSIGAQQLDQRINLSTAPKELQELAHSFNRMLDKVEKGYETLKNFSADIAHEFRTPLSNLSLQAQVALSQKRNESEYQDILYSSLEEYERLSAMINNMLWLAQSESAQLKIQLTRLKLDQEIEQVTEFFEYVAEDKQLTFNQQLESLEFLGEKDMIRRVINNLISNAIRHATDKSAIDIKLARQTISDTPFVLLQVSNKGNTIPQDALKKIFERFYQVDDSRSTGGSGLGLAIVKAIVELHKGKITCNSQQGKTTFEVLLPAKLEYVN